MQLIDGKPVFSATDLVGYLACEHLTALERAALDGPCRPAGSRRPRARRDPAPRPRARGALPRRAARRREARDDDRAATRRTSRATACAARRRETVAAMADGADAVYQATFFDGRWLGYADFLLRVESPDRPSVWGPYHYEVADTKLARHVKAGAVLQICSYVEQLTRIQGVRPRADEGRPRRKRTGDGAPARRRLHGLLPGGQGALRGDGHRDVRRAGPRSRLPADRRPTPSRSSIATSAAGRELCQLRRRADDHLSLVAGITARQRKALVARELDTVVRLAAAPIPFDPPLDGTGASSVERVREQARIQVEGRRRAEADPRAAAAQRRASRSSPSAGWPPCPRPTPATCSSTSRATRTRSTTASTTSSACSTSTATFTADLVVRPRRAGRGHPGRREGARSSALIDFIIERLDALPAACTSTTTRRTSRPR